MRAFGGTRRGRLPGRRARRSLARRQWGPFWEGNRAARSAAAVVHTPRAGGHRGDLEAAQAAGKGAAPRWGQQLDLGAVVERVVGQRMGQAERLGVALGVVGGVVQVEQVQVGQDVGRRLEGGDVGVGDRLVQGQGQATAPATVERHRGRPLVVQRQVGRG